MTTKIIGTDGIEFPDSSKQAASAIGNGPAFIARKTQNQTIPATTPVKMTMDVEDYDTNNCFDLANSKFIPNVAGFYQVNGLVYVNNPSGHAYGLIYKNGSIYLYGSGAPGGVSGVSGLVYMNGTTDYLELYGYATSTTAYAGAGLTHFSAFLARKA